MDPRENMLNALTPVKRLTCSPNVSLKNICRTCSINIPISGRGRHNIFEGSKSVKEKLGERLSGVLNIPVVQEDVLSKIICSKCKRELEKLERSMGELQRFKDLALSSANRQRSLFKTGACEKENTPKTREKRCKNSPCESQNKRKASSQTEAKRNILLNSKLHVVNNLEIQVHADVIVRPEPKAKNAKVEVNIAYPSRPVNRVINDDLDARIVRGVASKERSVVANAVWESSDIKELLIKKVENEIKAESSGLCSRSNPSILKDTKPDSIIALKDSCIVAELKERAPTLERILRAVVTGKGKDEGKHTDRENRNARSISMAAALLLRRRNPTMAAMSYRLAILLWQGGAEKQLFTRLSRWGFSMSHWRTLRKVDEFGVNFDGVMKDWKKHLEHSNNLESSLNTIQKIDKEEFLTCTSQTVVVAQDDSSQMYTIDESALKEKVKSEMSGRFIDAAFCEVTRRLQDKDISSRVYDKALAILKSEVEASHAAGYQVTGDNIDMLIKVKHMSSTNQNTSIHWFNMNAVMNRVHGNLLNNETPIKSILDVENSEFLPSGQDNVDYLRDLIPLVSRVAVTNIPALRQHFKSVTVWHIPHMYSKEMKEKSEQVPLGLLFKNENTTQEMIDILQELHEKYLPVNRWMEDGEEKVTVSENLFFGGDQLTDERARHCTDARSDGDTKFERLEGFLPKVEDWHAVRILYQVLYDIFFKPNSGNDVGTMCSNLNVINNVNARTTNVLDNFNECKGYVNFETDVFMTTAVMKYFDMETLNTPAESFIPPHILNGSKENKRVWLHKHMEAMLFQFVLADQQKQHEDLRDHVTAASRPQPVQTHCCGVCGKQYKYLKARDNHVKREHPYHSPQTQQSKPLPVTEPAMQDDRYNYARLRLSMGLLLRNFDDSIKEGDGGRTLRCWKFAMLLFRAYNHTKYALAALQLQACVQAMLSPRLGHSLTWNRTVNTKGGEGKNISLDLRLEHLNNLLKGLLKHLGPNMTEHAALRCSKSVGHVEQLLDSVDSDLQVKKPSGHHKVMKSEADFRTLVKELSSKGDVFRNLPMPQRRYQALPSFRSSLLQGLDFGSFNRWITSHKKEFFKLEPLI